ncbi:MAG: transposase [Desulfobacter sp.]|nr:transposase [Desulfobacter sp.]
MAGVNDPKGHLGQEVSANRRNGKSKKTIKSLDGKFELKTPRDRAGTFSPQIVKKHQTTLSDEIERKIIALYGLGMSYNDMASHLQEIYGLEISNATLSTITDKIIHTVKEWQARPLENVYPIVWLDAIHYKVRENGKVGSKAVYTILGVNIEGRKEVLGLYISENEGANLAAGVNRPQTEG